jgi:hypothetical protein
MADDNLYRRANGQRECRTCSAIRINNWRLKQKTKSAPGAPMDKSIMAYASLDAMKDDEYREWHEMRPYERLNAAAELSLGAYKAEGSSKNVSNSFQRTLVRLERPQS